MIQNPPWVDQILSENWEDLVSLLGRSGQGDFLPSAAPAGPRRGRSRVTISPTDELGCGHYGCVVTTGHPGIVCKITTDESEAAFVEAAWGAFGRAPARWPRGIVRYHKIVGLTDGVDAPSPTKGITPSGATWLLWRNEAWDVGQVDFDAHSVFRGYRNLVRAIRIDMQEAGTLSKSLKARVISELGEAIDLIETVPELDLIASALRALLEHEMALGDVHAGNIGRTAPGKGAWVITDPGHFVALGPAARRAARGTVR